MRTPRPVPSRRGLLRVAAAAPLGVLLAGSLIDSVGFTLPLLLPVITLPLTGLGFAWALRRRASAQR